jgi:hypothetical protein
MHILNGLSPDTSVMEIIHERQTTSIADRYLCLFPIII